MAVNHDNLTVPSNASNAAVPAGPQAAAAACVLQAAKAWYRYQAPLRSVAAVTFQFSRYLINLLLPVDQW